MVSRGLFSLDQKSKFLTISNFVRLGLFYSLDILIAIEIFQIGDWEKLARVFFFLNFHL